MLVAVGAVLVPLMGGEFAAEPCALEIMGEVSSCFRLRAGVGRLLGGFKTGGVAWKVESAE